VFTTSDKALTLFHNSLAAQERMQQNSNRKGPCTLLANSRRSHALMQKIDCRARALLRHKLLVMPTATGGS